MKIRVLFLILFVFGPVFTAVANVTPVASIKGKVTDKETHAPIAGAVIGISSLRIGTTTDANGEYILVNVPKAKLLVAVSKVGYKTVSQVVDFATATSIDFSLEISVIEANEVVVTGSPILGKNARNSTSIEIISRQELTQSGATNLVDGLSKIPGVSQVTTGGAISKPVIRGMSYNRVLTINNDIKQEGQQWGDEHGIEIDQYSAAKVEVLRGPASLFYGSDALGGVINIVDPVVTASNSFSGRLASNYSTNNGLTANNLQFEGNTNGLVYRLNGTYKNAMSFKSPTERVYNSAFKEDDFGAMIGMNKSWGFAHLTYTRFNTKIGLTEGERDNEGNFIDPAGNPVSETDLTSRNQFLPFQHVTHQKIALNSNVSLGKGFLKSTLGFQNNQRREFEESSTDPATYFYLNTTSVDSKYYFETINGWAPVIGISGTAQINSNKGEEAMIPAYNMVTGGIFAYAKKEWDNLTLDVGLRYDIRKLEGKQEFQFNAFTNRFSNVSGSVGITYRVGERLNLKANAGHGFRAPNIAELSANGVHEGAFRYEIGSPDLNQETSWQFDGAIEWEGKYFDAGLSGYYNFINKYIYIQNTNNEEIDVDGELFPVYRYLQGNSILRGFELNLDFHPWKAVHFQNSFAFTRGLNNDTKSDLPFIPQAKLVNTIRYDFGGERKSRLADTFISLQLESCFDQNKVDPFETTSEGYVLLNASVGTTLHAKSGRQLMEVFIAGRNLTNTHYIDHLNRFKEIDILNMARNITFGISIPLGKGI